MSKTDTKTKTKTKPVDPLDKILCARHRDLIETRVGKDRVDRFVAIEIAPRLRAAKPELVLEAKKTGKPIGQLCCKLGDAGINDAIQGKPIKFAKKAKPEKTGAGHD